MSTVYKESYFAKGGIKNLKIRSRNLKDRQHWLTEKRTKGQTMIYTALIIKLKFGQNELH